MNRHYVKVICVHELNGKITPLYIVWDNGIRYKIDRILQCCQAASLKSGGSGMRYTCLFDQECRYLFHDHDKWFIEKR